MPIYYPAATGSSNNRFVAFPLIGQPPASQKYSVAMVNAGTLVSNGAESYVPTYPNATENLVINTIHSGTITAQGTISINTGGTVTFPNFGTVAIAAGDIVQIVNQATQDATFKDASFSIPFVQT